MVLGVSFEQRRVTVERRGREVEKLRGRDPFDMYICMHVCSVSLLRFDFDAMALKYSSQMTLKLTYFAPETLSQRSVGCVCLGCKL